MFKSFFTIILRSLFRQGVFSVINILGLSIGLAVVVLMSLMNFYELSFDKSFKESKNIYRINAKLLAWIPGETSSSVACPVGKAMKEAVPEVSTTVRVIGHWFNVSINDNLRDIPVRWVDEDFFRLFDTPFLLGTPEDLMSRPNAIALSESEAKKIFGNNNPIGEFLIHTATWTNQPPVEVVAVFKDYPANSSFSEFIAILPLRHHYQPTMYENQNWGGQNMGSQNMGSINYETFCLLVPNANVASVTEKMNQVLLDATASQRGEAEEFFYSLQLQRLTDIHLHSSKNVGTTRTTSLSDIERVKILSLLSAIILLVACINYMNLSAARAQKRSREIGISKTVGASRFELKTRLTLETAVFTFLAFIIAFMIAWALVPTLNDMMRERLDVQPPAFTRPQIELALQPLFLCFALLAWVVTTLLAAAYPALYMSGFPPLTAIRSQFTPGSSHAIVRKILTVGQFVVAIVLIAWVLIVKTQIEFINNKDLGYNPRNLIGFWTSAVNNNILEALENDFRAQSSVEITSFSSVNFLRGANAQEVTLRKNDADQTGFSTRMISTTPGFTELMQMKLIAGRHLPEMQLRDTVVQYEGKSYNTQYLPVVYVLLNRAAVDYLELTPEEAIGRRLPQFGSLPVEICGVVENFHFESMHSPIRGYCMTNLGGSFLILRVTEGNLSEKLKVFEEIYNKHFPDRIFVTHFLDEYLAGLYDGEQRTIRIATVFSILAIFIACLGVFGLTAFMVERRTKEIGIRKVVGASVWEIVKLFTYDYVKLLGISLVIAIPIAWWIGERYLQNFAYRISLSWWIFVVAVLITAALTLLTVSVLAIKAALANPVKSIKTE